MPSKQVKIGLQLPEAERVVRWPELRDMAVLAEDIGFDSLWVGDHLLYRPMDSPPKAPWEAWTLLAALAVVTTRVEIGPLVACTSFHNPAILAKQAATIDELSGGRLILGLGAGWNELEYRAFGVAYDHRVSRFEEAFTIVRRLLAEGAVDFHGTYYQADDCLLLPPAARPAGPPLMVGSCGPRMLAITLPHVTAWNAWYGDYGNDVDALMALNERISAACVAVGRDPATVQRTAAVLVGMTGSTGRTGDDPADAAIAPLTGSPEVLADTLACFGRAGMDHLQIVLDPITIESIEECGQVLSALDAQYPGLRGNNPKEAAQPTVAMD